MDAPDTLIELLFVSLPAARAGGLARYMTGRPCKHGHVSERFTCNQTCVACARNICASGYQRNKPIRCKKQAKYRTEHSAFYKLWQREYCRNNSAAAVARTKKWQANNREKFLEQARIYAQNRSWRIKAGGKISRSQIRSMYEDQRGECISCQSDFSSVGYHIDHIMPLSLGGVHEIDNIQLLCPSCNLRKGSMPPDIWASIIAEGKGGRNP